MRKTINATHIEGILYEHNLELRVTGKDSKNPGTEYISGSISVATDDAMTNIVTVYFNYVVATFNSGKTNDTYVLLKNIIDNVFGTYMKDGQEKAIKVRIDSSIGLNEFYTERDGKTELVSVKRNDGGFVHRVDIIDSDEKNRNTFKVDILITGVKEVEGDVDKGTQDKVIVKGAIFDYFKNLLPVEFTAINKGAMDYFLGLDASQKNPVFTCIWGRQVAETIVKKITTESAFGEDQVREVKNTRRDFVITGAAKEPYMWDDESTITATELMEAIQKREVDLAAMKKRQDEYKAKKASAIQPANAISSDTFNF